MANATSTKCQPGQVQCLCEDPVFVNTTSTCFAQYCNGTDLANADKAARDNCALAVCSFLLPPLIKLVADEPGGRVLPLPHLVPLLLRRPRVRVRVRRPPKTALNRRWSTLWAAQLLWASQFLRFRSVSPTLTSFPVLRIRIHRFHTFPTSHLIRPRNVASGAEDGTIPLVLL